MSDKIIENNQVTIMGQVATTFEFSHEVFGEGFYTMEVLVKRLSNSEDRIPVMISERLIDVTQDYVGEYIIVQGQFRSYNRHEEQKNRLVLSVFAREVSFVESDEDMDGVKTNSIFWTAISVKHRYTERLRLEGKLRTFCWPSTDRTGNQTIFHVSAGDVTQGLPPRLKSARMYIFSDGYRAGNI